MTKKPTSSTSSLYIGSAYYPEHWPEERWPEDIRLMREAGFTVARLAEFAWSTLEPAAGQFEFSWLDRAINKLAAEGIVTVLGTPTAAPPAWQVQQHPSVLAVDKDGRPVQFGNRCHYCVNSEAFHEASHRIVDAMAEYFGSNPHVIGWQLDNEYNRVCYCDQCRRLFQRYLAQKFETLDSLNQRWATHYWSQTYSDWEQIPIPIGWHNPGLLLAFRQFVTESYRKFQRLQIDALRPKLQPEVWITHNFMGWFESYDHYEMAEDLDMASLDLYVQTGHHEYLETGARHDLTRGFKRRNYWLMETQPSNVNWLPINNVLNKGEVRAMAWHAIAHGADAILYWQWRSALGGQEQYHGTLVDQSGQPRPLYEEAKQIGEEIASIAPLITRSNVPGDVALLNCYDSRWSISWQRHHKDFDYVEHFTHYYRPLAMANIRVDIISADAPLDGYKLAVAPALAIIDESRAARLRAFVEEGGHLVLTIRTGMKDDCDGLLPSRQPGPLAEIAGVEVEEYYALLDPVQLSGDNWSGTSQLWAERLRVIDEADTQVLATYNPTNGWLDGHPAITRHAVGKGIVYFIGAYLDEETQKWLMRHIASTAGIKPVLETPSGVEASIRLRPDNERIYFLINHGRDEKRVNLPWPAKEYLCDQLITDEIVLAPYDVAILAKTH